VTPVARGQVPLAAIEAGMGLLLLLALVAGFSLGVAPVDTRSPQLTAYAQDAATILANEQPRHQGSSRLAELTGSQAAFDREREALRRRADRILPDNVMFRIETRQGTVGHRLPPDVPTGTATVTTASGTVTIRVWYV
jgi:hypothetical protein